LQGHQLTPFEPHLYSAQQKFEDAEPLFKRALAIRERQDIDAKLAELYFQRYGETGIGGDHHDVADTLDAYATFLCNTGRTAEAKKLTAHIQDPRGHPFQEH